MADFKRPPKGKVFRYNHSLEKKYSKRLKELTSKMTASTRRELIKLFEQTGVKDNFSAITGISSQSRILLNKLDRDWRKKFKKIANALTPAMMKAVLKESKSASLSSLRALYEDKMLKINENDTTVVNVFKASVNQAVELFQTIPEEYFKRVKGSVMRTITSNGSLSSLVKEFRRYDDFTIHRAENLALDQTRKAFSSYNREMCKSVGVKKARWVHVDRTLNPRKKHKDFDGKVFDLEKGAPVGTMKNGSEYVHPAEEPFCNCTFVPILEWEIEENEKK